MTSDSKKRLILYPVVLVVLAGLAYGGFVYEAEPDVQTLVGSAEVLAQCGMLDEAIENAERALRQEPDNRYAHIILGYAHGQKGALDDSLAHYDAALAVTPVDDENRPLLRLYRAEILVRAGRAGDAEAVAREIVAADPDDHQARFVLARALRAQDRLDEAVEEYRTVEDAAPEDPEPLALRAEVERAREDLEEALELQTRAVELAPGRLGLRLTKAELHEARGERDQAVAEVEVVAAKQKMAVRRWLHGDRALAGLAGDPRVAAAIAFTDESENAEEIPLKAAAGDSR